MKSIHIFLLIVIFFLCASVSVAQSAYFFRVGHECEQDVCIEGQKMVWMMNITNDGHQITEYTGVEFLSRDNDTYLGGAEYTFFPQSEERGTRIVVRPGQTKTTAVEGVVPAANSKDGTYFYPCLTVVINSQYQVAKGGVYTNRFCYDDVEFLVPTFQCVSHSHCSHDYYCSSRGTCQQLNCGECEYISNHKCEAYDCCQDDHCAFDAKCENNVCNQLGCTLEQYIFNRTCINLACGPDEVIMNRSCKKLDCEDDEYGVNHTCQPLVCEEYEFIKEHDCKPLKCLETEHAVNHTCQPLRCMQAERIINNKCIPLDCRFFQNPLNHRCVNDMSLIIKFIIELLIVIGILAFVYLDIRAYRHKDEEGPSLFAKRSKVKTAGGPLGVKSWKDFKKEGGSEEKEESKAAKPAAKQASTKTKKPVKKEPVKPSQNPSKKQVSKNSKSTKKETPKPAKK